MTHKSTKNLVITGPDVLERLLFWLEKVIFSVKSRKADIRKIGSIAIIPIVLISLLAEPAFIAPANGESLETTPMTLMVPEVSSKDTASTKTAPAVQPNEVQQTFTAYMTQYSRADSCHNVNKNGQCIMASGKAVYVGAAACPNFLRLGTHLNIGGLQLTCEDRYAERLDHERRLPTVDVFVDANPHGRREVAVSVLH